MSTKVISEKPILEAYWFTVNEVNLQLKNGEEKVYTNARRKPSVMVLPVTDAGDVYLIKQYRYMIEDYDIEAVAGFLDPHETPFETAKRELKEESGLVAKHWKDIGTYRSASSVITWNQTNFIATGLTEEEQRLEPDEDITLLKISLEEAVGKVLTNEISDEPTATAILLASELRRRGEL